LSQKISIGIGIERLDYTKGIIERFLSIEKLLEKFPKWREHFIFIQVAAPTRSRIKTYKKFESEVQQVADRINQKFGTKNYKPIILMIEHIEPPHIFEYYRAADLCFVSSLHDGMNLVAKEFISARPDEQGVLILSLFAGASRELHEALIVNPYDIDQCAEALNLALHMPVAEQRERMRSMRKYIEEHNVFRWAGKMLLDASRVRRRNRILQRISTLSGEETEYWRTRLDEAFFYKNWIPRS
ncbi:MAG TPA: trehalose-6-phosphate synthase, partial [Bdellovibrionota bacterium]|nr:trehalose-6-phosphate synthase [Bdellovibrionota bacterium]